ncbi:MAG: ATP-dependent Clp protease adaptor ClpS, partial [Phycisphaerales bacterium]
VERESTSKPSAATKSRTAPPRVDRLPPYKVLLHNDDQNDMLDVVKAIVELTPLRKEMAVERMFEAHARGVSLLLTTHKERAELYKEQFHTKRLTVSIEAAD